MGTSQIFCIFGTKMKHFLSLTCLLFTSVSAGTLRDDDLVVKKPLSTGGDSCSCSSSTVSAGWRKIFSHNSRYGYFDDAADALSRNADDESQPLFSRLSDIEQFRNAQGEFRFKLVYPEIPAVNEWIQTSNPTTESSITGFEAASLDITINSNDDAWAGLGLGEEGKSLMDDSPDTGRWWTAIGAERAYPTGSDTFPGLKKNKVTMVELYVYDDGASSSSSSSSSYSTSYSISYSSSSQA